MLLDITQDIKEGKYDHPTLSFFCRKLFGRRVFVKLEDDVEALVYSSEIDKEKAGSLKPGDQLKVKIIKVDVEQMKIGVSANI